MIALRLNLVLTASTKTGRNKRTYVVCDIDWIFGRLALAEQFSDKRPDDASRYHRKPIVMKIEELRRKIVNNEYTVSDEPLNPRLLFSKNITEDMVKTRDANWAFVHEVIEDPALLRDYLYNRCTGTVIDELCERFNHSKKHFYDTLHRCLSLGATRDACVPDYGGHPPSPPSTMKKPGKKRGRKPRLTFIQFRNWTAEDSVALNAFFKTIKNINRKRLVDIYCEYCLVVLKVVVDVVSERKIYVLGQCENGIISLATFRYHWHIDIPLVKRLRRQHGSVDFDNNYRGVTGSARFWVRGPTVRYEIDATTAEIYLRYALSNTKRISIGRPHVYIVIDVFTTMVVGLYVTMLDEEWVAAGQALYNAFTDKVAFCREFGVEINEAEWPCHHPCEQFTFDRGSLYSNNHIEPVLKSEIGTERANLLPAFKGSAKGICERALGYLIAETKDLQGTIDQHRRDLQHASNKALFTYHQYVRALIHAILDYNKYKDSVSLLDTQMVKHDIQAHPLDVWDYALPNYIGERHPISLDRLRFALFPEATATLTAHGVRFRGDFYANPACMDEFTRARTSGRETITIRHSKVILDQIFWRADSGTIYALDLTWNSRRMRGVSYADALVRWRIEQMEAAQNQAHKLAARIQRYKNKRDLEAEARGECAGMEPNYRKSMQPGIKNRKGDAAMAEMQKLRDDMLKDLGIDLAKLSPDMRTTFETDDDTLMDTLFDQMYGNTDSVDDAGTRAQENSYD